MKLKPFLIKKGFTNTEVDFIGKQLHLTIMKHRKVYQKALVLERRKVALCVIRNEAEKKFLKKEISRLKLLQSKSWSERFKEAIATIVVQVIFSIFVLGVCAVQLPLEKKRDLVISQVNEWIEPTALEKLMTEKDAE